MTELKFDKRNWNQKMYCDLPTSVQRPKCGLQPIAMQFGWQPVFGFHERREFVFQWLDFPTLHNMYEILLLSAAVSLYVMYVLFSDCCWRKKRKSERRQKRRSMNLKSSWTATLRNMKPHSKVFIHSQLPQMSAYFQARSQEFFLTRQRTGPRVGGIPLPSFRTGSKKLRGKFITFAICGIIRVFFNCSCYFFCYYLFIYLIINYKFVHKVHVQ